MYNLYNGDKTGGLDNIEDLIGTEHLTFNHLDRYGGNTAIRFTSNDTKIRIPTKLFPK